MHFIVTGFDAFNINQNNPSQKAVETLQLPASFDKINITKLILSSCCDAAWAVLQDVLAKTKDDCFVLLTGLAQERDHITLERFALNVRDYRVPDNCGHQWLDENIDHSGPDAIKTHLPLVQLEQHMRRNGYHSDISNYAGAFVCNEVYYRCLRYYQSNSYIKGVLFVHLPPPQKYVHNPKLLSDEQEVIEIFADALQEIIGFCLAL